MFYELETLESHLKCPVCSQTFVSPRILPCGKSICLNCIHVLTKNDQLESLFCPICQKDHTVPHDGFILNEFILNTLKLKPQKVFRCASFEKFDQLLSKIKNDLTEMEEKLQRPGDKIVEYCDRLRNKIDIRTEMLIDKLHSIRNGLLTELKRFEHKCLKNVSITSETKQLFETQLDQVAHKLAQHNKYINQAKIEEDAVKRMLAEAKINEFNLSNYTRLLDGKLFGSSVIEFEEGTGDEPSDEWGRSILGRLCYEELKSDKNMLDLDKLALVKPDQSIECRVSVDRVIELDTRYIVASENTIKIFEKDAESLNEIRFDQNPEFLLTNHTDLILVQHTRNIWKNNRKEKNAFASLSVYDLELNLKSEISPDFSIASCCGTKHNIFVQADRTMVVNVFNWSLEKITSFGQVHFCEKPYFFKEACLQFVKDDRMYLKRAWPQNSEGENSDQDGFIRVVSLTNGELIGQYSLNLRDEYFMIDALGRTIVIDVVGSWLRIYDKPRQKIDQVELVYETEIDGLKDVTDLRLTDDGKLGFIKNKCSIQYVSFYS